MQQNSGWTLQHVWNQPVSTGDQCLTCLEVESVTRTFEVLVVLEQQPNLVCILPDAVIIRQLQQFKVLLCRIRELLDDVPRHLQKRRTLDRVVFFDLLCLLYLLEVLWIANTNDFRDLL